MEASAQTEMIRLLDEVSTAASEIARLRAALEAAVAICGMTDARVAEAKVLADELAQQREQYNELLYAVGNKYPGTVNRLPITSVRHLLELKPYELEFDETNEN